jgi:hypothetical protein
MVFAAPGDRVRLGPAGAVEGQSGLSRPLLEDAGTMLVIIVMAASIAMQPIGH